MTEESAQDIQYICKFLSKYILRTKEFYIIMDIEFKNFIL